VKFLVAAIGALGVSTVLAQSPATPPPTQPEQPERPSFTEWLDGVRSEALTRGIRQEVVNDALANIEEPLPVVLERDRAQAESVLSIETYLSRQITARRVRTGREMLAKHKAVLDKVAKTYGVPVRIIGGIWGMESNFGRFSGVRPTVAALATLAWDPRRSSYFRGELFNALEILNRGDIDLPRMKGSWAGAMGQPQFMPSSYLQFAQDFDGDGHRDIWTTPDDVFASIANYLKGHGWNESQTWGREVSIADCRGRGPSRGHLPRNPRHDGYSSIGEVAVARGAQPRGRYAAEGGHRGQPGVGQFASLPGLWELRRAARIQLRPRVRPERRAARRSPRCGSATAGSVEISAAQTRASRTVQIHPPSLGDRSSCRERSKSG